MVKTKWHVDSFTPLGTVMGSAATLVAVTVKKLVVDATAETTVEIMESEVWRRG